MRIYNLLVIPMVMMVVSTKARFTDEMNYKIYQNIDKNPLCGVTRCHDKNTKCGIGFDSLPINIKGEDCVIKDAVANYYETFRKESDDKEDRVGMDAIAYCPSTQYNISIFGVLNSHRNYCINDMGDRVSFDNFFYPRDKEIGKIDFGYHSILKSIMVFKYYGYFGISCTKTWDLFFTINEKVGCTPEEIP
ncbi:hypothetical protein PIROE2DRAFT_16009 [Piromyces sp. E2]|nr:hypothetical protein PIROE2DRAFT_16009 [Piromyces sp. E2]|eukprot:OUM58652.1 hypothetical protein PIROE2DRAFT_16009 [Piromyces sp. E2]